MPFFTVNDDRSISLSGNWTLSETSLILSLVKETSIPDRDTIVVDASGIDLFDSSGALALCHLLGKLERHGKTVTIANLDEKHKNLLSFTEHHEKSIGKPEIESVKHNYFYRVGERTIQTVEQAIGYINFIGEVSTIFSNILSLKRSWQWRNTLCALEAAGYHAIPIVSLLIFLIGVVLSYQLGLQLESYGANIFIVNLTGLAVLREFGPLITAIIVAGRTASSFTAEIGLMKVNEELDALRVMGLNPINRIVLPKIIAVVIAMPLLTIVADVFGVFGSMVMSKVRFGISMQDFLERFDNVTELSSLWTGLYKAPFFGLIIASIGCYQGLQVLYTADSIGKHTTRSVVQAIFLVIIADAIFSVLYSMYGI